MVLSRKSVHSWLFVPKTIPPFSIWHLIMVITVWHGKHWMQNIISLSCQLVYNHLKPSITRIIRIAGFYRFLRLVSSYGVSDFSPESSWSFQKVQSSEICYFKSDNQPKEKKMIDFPCWRGILQNEPSKFAMQLPGASHPQGLTRDRSDLSAWRADWNYLPCWGFIPQWLLLEAGASASFLHRAL